MHTKHYSLHCVSCGKTWKEEETCTNCLACGNALDVQMDHEYIAHHLNRFALSHAPLSAAKYLDFYPITSPKKMVSLNEGGTPLHHAKKLGKKLGLPKLYIKNEGINPTGVFKDRGSLVEMTKALELGAKAVAVASTGNMAASIAAYASQANLPCYIFVPEGTPIGKLSQTLSYGGRLIQIRGTYADCVTLAEQMAKKHHWYLAGDYAFRAEGAKSTSFEIIEQLHWSVPDVVICPMGCGTNLSGIWKGFSEWQQLELIDRVPKMVGVQPVNCDTLCVSFREDKERYTFVDKPKTVASAVGIGVPQDDIKALHALRNSDGDAEVATEEEILEAQQHMAREESIFVEPSSAIPLAVLTKLLKRGVIDPEQTIVLIATGIGLKDPQAALQSFAHPSSIESNIEDIEHYLETGTPRIQKERDAVLFTEVPKKEALQTSIEKEFEYKAIGKVLDFLHDSIAAFLLRGKTIKKADLLSLIEEAIENESIPETPLRLEDFSITSGLKEKPKARISLSFYEHKRSAEGEGVGPFDALVVALKKAIENDSEFWPELDDFQVNVTSGKENAVVRVSMKMRDEEEKNTVTAHGSSPDILLASLLAFLKGYNMLFHKKGV